MSFSDEQAPRVVRGLTLACLWVPAKSECWLVAASQPNFAACRIACFGHGLAEGAHKYVCHSIHFIRTLSKHKQRQQQQKKEPLTRSLRAALGARRCLGQRSRAPPLAAAMRVLLHPSLQAEAHRLHVACRDVPYTAAVAAAAASTTLGQQNRSQRRRRT